MPRYNITDPDSGASLVVEGDSPPSEQELTQIFKQHADRNLSTLGPWLQRTDIPQPEPSTPLTARQQNLTQIERLREEDPGGWARNLEAGGIVPGFLQAGQRAVGEAAQGAGVLTETGPVSFPGFPPTPFEAQENLRRMKRTPAETQAEIERNPLYVAGQAIAETAPETHPVPPKAEGALPTKIAETAGGFFPLVASGGTAPMTIALQSVGAHLSGDYEAAKKEGKTDNEAADIAMNKALASGATQAAIWTLLPPFLRNVTDDWIIDRFGPAVGTQVVKRFLVGRAAQTAEMGALGAVSGGTEAAIEGQPVLPAAAGGAAGLGVLGLVTPRGPTRFEAEAKEAFLGEPKPGAMSPDAQAWAQTFGYGTGQPVTAIRAPQAVVRPTQPFVPPEPGPMGVIPPLEPSTERPTDATTIGQQRGSEETQLPGVRQGENVPAYPAEVRQAPGGQAAGGGGAQPSPQGQAAPAPDELLNRDRARYAELTAQLRQLTAQMRPLLAAGDQAGIQNVQQQITAINQETNQIINRYGGKPPPEPGVAVVPAARPPEGPAPAAPVTPPAAAPAGVSDETTRTLFNRGWSRGEIGRMTPAQADALAAAGTRPDRNLTPELAERARDLRQQAYTLNQERALTPDESRNLFQALQDMSMGDFTAIQEQLPVLAQRPMKPPKVVRRVTSLSRFREETDVPDILTWISENMRLLSRSSARKQWGSEKYDTNKELWDDAPDDLPMHHSTAIYGGRNGPDTVAQAAFEAGLIKSPYTSDLWAAVRQASRVRRGLEAGETREAKQLSEEEQSQIAWDEATRQSEGKLPVTTEEVGPGYVIEVGGERLTVSEPTDQGDVYLTGSKKFGDRTLYEGDTIYVDALHPPTGQTGPDWETGVETGAPQLPKVPAPLPKGIPQGEREQAFADQRARWDKYNADVAAWEAAQPQNRPIIFRRGREERASFVAITPDPQGGWRATTFSYLYPDLDKVAPWGHERYSTRLEAVREHIRDGVVAERIPEVMTEEELRQERERRNPPAPTTPEAPKPAKFSGDAPVGTIIDGYIKADTDKGPRWFKLDEEGNRRNLPPANAKQHKALEAKAALPPAPPETRTPAQILSAAKSVRIKGPPGATFIRITDTNGRKSQMSIRDVNDGDNVFQGVDIAQIEAGTINREKKFQPIEGDVTVEDVGKTARMLEPTRAFSKELEDEIKFQQDTVAESGEGQTLSRTDAIRRLMEDMDDPESYASSFKKELQDFGIKTGIYKANTKAEIDAVVRLGRGKKYDFKRGDTYYTFDSWKPLEGDRTSRMLAPSEAPPAEKDLLSSAEYERKLRANYYDESGAPVASSRQTPAMPQGLTLGMWRVDTHKGPYGREISQLRLLDPNTLGISEHLVEENIEGRGWDADRYAQWIKEGKLAPPIEVVETDGGKLQVTNGHRRLAAAKAAGQPVLAWVSPSMDVPRTEGGKLLRYDGDPNKPVIKTGLTVEAWRSGEAKRTLPLQGGFSSEGVPRPEGFRVFDRGEGTAKPMPEEQVAAHLQQQFGVQPGGIVKVVNNPGAEWRGESDLKLIPGTLRGDNGRFPLTLTEIRINAAKLSTPEDINDVFEHELAHGADEVVAPMLRALSDAELKAIVDDVKRYPFDEQSTEVRVRTLTKLADSWKGRNWFEKSVGAVLDWAHKVGVPLTRLAAERIAARAIADQLTFVQRGSVLNQPAVARVVHSLALSPKDWNMKQFFNTIGLQAGTIGGYLHRYTRQVFHADALEVSDRARALDGMNQARELTELAQGMGGRANYYDAIRDATTQGERNEVLRSAFESATRYQQTGVNLRAKLAEKRAEIQSPAFRNKLLRASRTRERAELAEEVRRTYTLQVAASAGRIMQTLSSLRTLGGAHEQLQADLTRLQQMPQFDRAVQQHFDAIVNSLSQSERGISLLLGGGDRTGQDIWDEYLRQRFAAHQGIPQGNEFTLGQLASNVLAANRDLRNQFGSLALLARDIITTQEWNRAASKIAQALQNDPVKAIPRILQRAATMGSREGRAETAFLTLNKGIEKTLRDYNDHEQAVRLHAAVEADPEYRQWVNDVMQDPAVQGLPVPEDVRARMEGKPQPFFRYVGQETVYSPDGKPYHVNLQFTPENVQQTMADLINLNADISDWLDRPVNANDPSRLYWQERQRLLTGVLQSSAIWNPGAIESLLTRSSFGIPENLFQGLALPSAKLAFNAFKGFDRYFTQGKGWYGNNHDVSERTIQRAYKGQGFNELNRKAYQRAFLNALGWEFRNGRDVRPGDIINGVVIKAEDLALLHSEGRMINDLYDRMWKAGREAGAPGVMELPRIIDEFTGGAWGLRRPMEIGIHANTTLPHSFSSHGEALANQIHSLITARNNELTRLPERVAAEGMDEAAQNAARADIHRRYHEQLALTLNDPDVFQNAVLGFMRQRSENWVKLDGLSPFEQHYRAITDLVSNGDPTAPRTVEEVLDWIHQRLPPEEEWSMPRVQAQFASEWEKLGERFHEMHSKSDSGIRITSDKRQTAFTQAFRQDLGPAYFYDYGWIDAGEMRRYGTDMAEFGFERLMESLNALDKNMTEALAEITAAAESRKPELVKRTAEAYKQGKDFRDLQHLQNKQLELQKLINAMPKWIGANAVHAEGMSLKGMSRFVSFMIGAALTGPRTAARISGISMGGSAWKMGIVFSQLGYGRLRSYPAAAASAITSAFRVGTATALGWYHGGERGFVPGVPLRVLMNVPGAVRSAAAAKGSEKLYSAIESILRNTTDEQFAALGWWFDQKALGMTPDVALGSRVAGILSASRTKGGVLARPQNIPIGTASRALRAVKLAGSKPLAALEAFVAGTNVYLPGAFGYNITYDAVGRQAGWYIDMLAANARRTFDTYERLGQLDRFNFDNLTDPRNKLQPWEVLPSFAARFRFVDPAKLPGWARPNSTNLQFARELFATSTDVDLQDLLLRYWKRLAETPREQRGAVEFLAPEEMDPTRATASAEARARGIISRFVEQTHHAAPSNRPHQLQQAWPIQAILPFMGWSAQTLKLIDATLGRAAFSTERNGMTADSYSALVIAAAMTALGVGAFAFAGGDLEARLIRQLDRLLHHKEGTVKTIEEAQDAKEAAEITLHNMTASIPMLNSTLNQLFGMTGYRGGNVGFQAFAFDKVNSMLTYARDAYRTHDLTHGLDRLAEANIPISETIIENTFQREGLQNNRNAVRVLQKLGPQDLVERRASLSIALPTEMTPYRQALLEAVGSGDQKLVAETYAAFIEKATELGRPEPEKLARQMFSTLNPYRQAFGGVLTDQQRADTLAKASDTQRKMIETMEQNYALAASTLGLTADFEKQEKAPPIQRSGAGAGGGGGSFPSGRSPAGAGGGGMGRIGTGMRRISLSGPKPPRIRLPGLGAPRGAGAAKSSGAIRTRLVHGRLSARSSKPRRLSAGRKSRRRISLLA